MSEQQKLDCTCVFKSVTWNVTWHHFLQNMEDMEKGHDAFLQGAQQELRKEMATLQKKILMDTVSEESWDREREYWHLPGFIEKKKKIQV